MTEANKILKLIESLKGYTEEEILRDHVGTLNEIDARFWCWACSSGLNGYYHKKIFLHTIGEKCVCELVSDDKKATLENRYYKKVTRSIDAQQPYVPEGWRLARVNTYYNTWECEYFELNCRGLVKSEGLPTEPLARLYALVQVIQWERENENI